MSNGHQITSNIVIKELAKNANQIDVKTWH